MPERQPLSETTGNWRLYAKVSNVEVIARRYFVMNAFDGALTTLGVVIGAYLAGRLDPTVIILAGMSGAIAMAISGFSGAYLTETAERSRKLKRLERAMLNPMDDTVQGQAARFATTITALVDAISPLLASLCILIPFVLAEYGLVQVFLAFYLSIVITLVLLLLLGAYLAYISDESVLKYGSRMLFVGMVTAFACILLALILGGGGI
ncbi:MAG: VIT1/CCC1 transporter family protein [Euryarchaeota archaeon]|nr:VIT1/CCC1 transporter family protein [Euryarchaeota archaeon]